MSDGEIRELFGEVPYPQEGRMNQKKMGLSEREEQMAQDFMNDRSARQKEWLEKTARLATLQGRLEIAAEEAETLESHKVFARFIVGEIQEHGMMVARVAVYSPIFEEMSGKLLIEVYSKNAGKLFFELTLGSTTDFSSMAMDDLGSDPWNPFFRYHKIDMNGDQALLLLKELLFHRCFTHSFLMTTASDALGVMTTHELTSDAGEVLSFRRWSLSV